MGQASERVAIATATASNQKAKPSCTCPNKATENVVSYIIGRGTVGWGTIKSFCMQMPSMMLLSSGLVLPSSLLLLTAQAHLPFHHNEIITRNLSVCSELLGVTCDRVTILSFCPIFEWEFPCLACQCGPCHCRNKSSWSLLSHFQPSPSPSSLSTNSSNRTLFSKKFSWNGPRAVVYLRRNTLTLAVGAMQWQCLKTL